MLRSSSPSAWSDRLPIMGLAACGLVVATALAAYQLKLVAHIWDPFFGSASSARVVTAPILSWLPIPDALLGMGGYAADLLSEAIGDEARWRRTPWQALLFGLVISSMALVSVGLVVVQTFVVHSWCSLCLASALISWTIFVLGIKEPIASARYLWRAQHQGVPLGHALWGRSHPAQQHHVA